MGEAARQTLSALALMIRFSFIIRRMMRMMMIHVLVLLLMNLMPGRWMTCGGQLIEANWLLSCKDSDSKVLCASTMMIAILYIVLFA